jgi:hypothetical protein
VNCGPDFDHTGICKGHPQDDFAGGEGGVCLGGNFVTPFGGVVLQGCWVGGNQEGWTFTHAWGAHVKGLSAGADISGFSSNSSCIPSLGGNFHSIGGNASIFGASKSTGNGVNVFGYDIGLGSPLGGYDTTTNTNTSG